MPELQHPRVSFERHPSSGRITLTIDSESLSDARIKTAPKSGTHAEDQLTQLLICDQLTQRGNAADGEFTDHSNHRLSIFRAATQGKNVTAELMFTPASGQTQSAYVQIVPATRKIELTAGDYDFEDLHFLIWSLTSLSELKGYSLEDAHHLLGAELREMGEQVLVGGHGELQARITKVGASDQDGVIDVRLDLRFIQGSLFTDARVVVRVNASQRTLRVGKVESGSEKMQQLADECLPQMLTQNCSRLTDFSAIKAPSVSDDARRLEEMAFKARNLYAVSGIFGKGSDKVVITEVSTYRGEHGDVVSVELSDTRRDLARMALAFDTVTKTASVSLHVSMDDSRQTEIAQQLLRQMQLIDDTGSQYRLKDLRHRGAAVRARSIEEGMELEAGTVQSARLVVIKDEIKVLAIFKNGTERVYDSEEMVDCAPRYVS